MNGDSSDRGGEESRWSGKEEEKRGRKSSLLSVLASAGDSAQKRHFSLQQDIARTRNSISNLISELHSWFWKLKAGCLLMFSFWIVFEYYNLFCGL
nr:uncharacterized protein LOC113713662 isoform X2 [Coffea arabica]